MYDGYIGMVSVVMLGAVTSDDFGTRYGGIPIGNYDNFQNTGKEGEHNMRCRLYSVAKDVSTASESPWELFPEYEARAYTFISSIDGEECTLHDIVLRERKQEGGRDV